ncbi:non-specific serine/threonine protein kinase [Saccharopolyspora erythraea NRRL 2338]|uniref:Protein kinase/transcriptional regulator, LuxR family n=1 Tax=Saccharopolyspora erythraea (strain ATCC 11635 / DSM 40517 / JCM 4748 / NBRC 13426 / NCIMB 8594 / NRRL 2338) TaxID=405948 RepID=A4FJ92_SACEN|nr:non-specific serine/threonine protein kinase [Saccharopolyspora erythraea NRRL 2338]CAM04117.1 protein kinase/transcriptional regulator, LuxR family [Saccharopolyspora erythraea NRRL 2338]
MAPAQRSAVSTSLPPQKGNLPVDITTFVGRRREVTDVRQLLSSSRLVTLTGAGGVGKTRLALQAARNVRRAFPHGVWVVELGALRQPGLVVEAAAATLGIEGRSSRGLIDQLSDYVRDNHLLLVLDNCEHLLDSCALLADHLLRTAPRLTILATSREALNITGETVYPVLPMSLPEPQPPLPSVQALSRYEAVALFEERAKAIRPGFTVDDDNAAAVVQLCRRLDGMPLAIELAAARLQALSVEQVVQRLDDRYRLLTAGSRAALPQQQTLRALIDWSHDLCTPAERVLWARLSVFAGTFDLAAAETVCAGDGIEANDVAALVVGLVSKSVLLLDGDSPQPRYRLLETIRQYGAEQLTSLGDVATPRRHRDYFADLVAGAERGLFTPDQARSLGRLRREHLNLRALLEFCVTVPGEAPTGLVAASGLWQYWPSSGSLSEGLRWLDGLLAMSPEATEQRAWGLSVTAWLAILQGDLTSAADRLDEARTLGQDLDDRRTLGYVALFSGIITALHGDPQRARSLYEEALAYHRVVHEPIGIAMALYRSALIAFLNGDSQEVHARCDECCSLCDTYHERWWKAYALWVLGLQVWRDGDPQRATAVQSDAVRRFHEVNDLLGAALSMEAIAWVAAEGPRDEACRAATLLGAADTLWQALGTPLAEFTYLSGYRRDCEKAVRRTCGSKAYESAFDDGRHLDLDDAVRIALGDAPQRTERAASQDEWSLLTPREREIAALTTEGLSNKEISARLVISQRTAEAHIEHILVKLGFSSRSQIAAWAAEHQPTTG